MHHLTNLATQVGQALQQRGWKLATCESITGGGISQAITDIAGSSEWFDCGLVTYSNASKTRFLGVPETLIAEHGAVSEAVAAAMVRGALAHSDAQVSLSTTGIAGPGGAVPGKPVGTVWLAVARRGEAPQALRLQLPGDRSAVREATVREALSQLMAITRPT